MAVDDVELPINVRTTLPGLLKSHAQGDTAWFAAAALYDVSKTRGISAGSLCPSVNILA